jgi:hypothetical protein
VAGLFYSGTGGKIAQGRKSRRRNNFGSYPGYDRRTGRVDAMPPLTPAFKEVLGALGVFEPIVGFAVPVKCPHAPLTTQRPA